MASYKELLAQRQELDDQIKEAQRREKKDAIAQVRALLVDFELTAEDVFPSGRSKAAAAGDKRSKVAPKYRNPATQETWTGRGRSPKWLAGKNPADFLIK